MTTPWSLTRFAEIALVCLLAAGCGVAEAEPGSTGEARKACPVTIPLRPGLVPPKSYPEHPAVGGMVWYGTADLWTALPTDGSYERRKSVWWSRHFRGGREEPRPEIEVTWRRLDAGSAPITAGSPGTNAYTAEDGWFMIAGIDPKDPGCWEVTATYRGATVSYVYLVR